MKNLFLSEGTVLFPFELKIHFYIWLIYTTAKGTTSVPVGRRLSIFALMAFT